MVLAAAHMQAAKNQEGNEADGQWGDVLVLLVMAAVSVIMSCV